MSRPKKFRFVGCNPSALYFKPMGISLFQLEETVLNMDEFESIRLADYESMYHEDAAKKMNISRATFGRILKYARRKVADTIVNGKALKIEQSSVKEEG